MPRLKQSEADKQYSNILARLDIYTGERRREGWDCERIAKSLGLPMTTYYSRRKSPQRFTLQELQSVANTLNIKVTTLLSPIRADDTI